MEVTRGEQRRETLDRGIVQSGKATENTVMGREEEKCRQRI